MCNVSIKVNRNPLEATQKQKSSMKKWEKEARAVKPKHAAAFTLVSSDECERGVTFFLLFFVPPFRLAPP